MKTGLCTIAFRDRPLEEVLDVAREAGFDGVEPWGKPDHFASPYDADAVKRSAEAVRTRGLEVSQFGSYANPTSDSFDVEMDDAIRASRVFETDTIRVWAGDCGSEKASEAQWKEAIAGFRTFCDRAADAGLRLVVEMHNGRLSDTADGCLRLIEGVDRANFRMNFQPMWDHTPERVLEEATKVAPYVSTVHAQNYAAIGSNRRALIEEGVVDYERVIGIFREKGFDGYIEVEFVREEDPEGSLKRDAEYLRGLCG